MPANDTPATTSRSTHKWDEVQLTFVATHTGSRSELVADFRGEFPEFKGSDTAIAGRRYRVQRDGSTKVPGVSEAAIRARIETLEAKLAEAKAGLAKALENSVDVAEEAPVDYGALSFAELKALADEAGVKKSGGKAAIIARLAA